MYFIQMQQRDRQGAVGSFYEGEGAQVHWPPPPQVPTPLWAMRGQRGAPPPPRRLSRAKRSGQSSIGYRRRRLRGLQDEGRGVITRGRAEASGHEGRGAEVRDWAGGGGWVQVCEQQEGRARARAYGPGQPGRGALACVRGEMRWPGRVEACMRVG